MIAALIAALVAAPQPAETPRAFLGRLYAGYRNEGFNPLERPQRHFAPALAAAIEEDSSLSIGEVGFLDGDPLCQCQDLAGFRPEVGEVSPVRGGKADARVRLRLSGYADREIRLRLVRTAAGWRIADISTPSEPSLLHDLRRSNRERRRRIGRR